MVLGVCRLESRPRYLGGGVTPPKKSKIGGPNLRGGGPDVVELQNFKKIKDLLAENFWKNIL